MMINENCPCKNSGCPRNKNCTECQAFHAAREDYPLTSCQAIAAAKEKEEK